MARLVVLAVLEIQVSISSSKMYSWLRILTRISTGLPAMDESCAFDVMVGIITRKDVAMTHKDDMEVVEPDTPGEQANCDYSQSSFGGKSLGPRSSLAERTTRDVLFSLP